MYFIQKQKYSIWGPTAKENITLNRCVCCLQSCKLFPKTSTWFKFQMLQTSCLLCTLWGKDRGWETKENLFQQLIKIQRHWCYRAPIRKLSLHWQWRCLQPLLTALLVPVCESEPTASPPVCLWTERVQLTSVKQKHENPLTILPESLDARHKGLRESMYPVKWCLSQTAQWDQCGGMWKKKTRWLVVAGDYL